MKITKQKEINKEVLKLITKYDNKDVGKIGLLSELKELLNF